ncbi:MAG: sensor histidine kinase [Candidatus Saccharicenans sp.]
MSARKSQKSDQRILQTLKKEIQRLEKELSITRSALQAITSGGADAVIGASCPYVLKAKEAEDAIRKLLQEKDTLIKEIHHRVKNNLQIILSLIHLQMGNESSAEVKERLLTLQNRIKTMALIHEVFYRTEYMSSLNLADYLERVAVHLFNIYQVDKSKIKLVTEMEPVQVSINTAIPVGLIVNELLTNSIKHAFEGIPSGLITLKLRSLEKDKCQLFIADNGQGLPDSVDWKAPTTLGLELVRLLVDQIEASMSNIAGPGTSFELVFKNF